MQRLGCLYAINLGGCASNSLELVASSWVFLIYFQRFSIMEDLGSILLIFNLTSMFPFRSTPCTSGRSSMPAWSFWKYCFNFSDWRYYLTQQDNERKRNFQHLLTFYQDLPFYTVWRIVWTIQSSILSLLPAGWTMSQWWVFFSSDISYPAFHLSPSPVWQHDEFWGFYTKPISFILPVQPCSQFLL